MYLANIRCSWAKKKILLYSSETNGEIVPVKKNSASNQSNWDLLKNKYKALSILEMVMLKDRLLFLKILQEVQE